MKKLILLLLGSFIILMAKENKYLEYTNALMHYNFELKGFKKIKVPFEEEGELNGSQRIKGRHSLLEKKINVTLLAILNNSAYIQIDEYIGDSLIKSYKKWVKEGEEFEKYYKVKKITLSKIVLIFKNKIITKTINQKIPGIKEK